MIDREEAGRRARELVKQYVAEAGPEEPEHYYQLLTMLVAVAGATLANGAGPHEAVRRLFDVANDIAREARIAGVRAPERIDWKH